MILINFPTELFKIGSFSVQTWGTMVAIGILIAMTFIFIEANKRKLSEKIESMLAFMLVFGIIFGRLAYILINPSEFSGILQYFEIWNGGIISWGVIIGIFLGLILSKLIAKISFDDFYSSIDLMAPYLALASAIGRIGCLLRGCCFGIQSNLPWAVMYPGYSVSVHPTQIYHAIADFIIFLLLLKLYNKKKKIQEKKTQSKYKFFSIQGSIFFMFLMFYSAERFFIDFLRFHPVSEYFCGLSITQWMFIAIFIAALALLLLKNKIIKKK
jgi:phosphatidylglycerol:prolipoprotein diacylglycerol transferase